MYPEKDLAAGACMGDGVLFDISDRTAPREINRVQDDENFAFWHSATFNNAGTTVIFTDELGGGAATCNAEIGQERGADGIYDIVGRGDDRGWRASAAPCPQWVSAPGVASMRTKPSTEAAGERGGDDG